MRKYFFLLIALLVLASCVFEYEEGENRDEDRVKIKQVFLNILNEFTMYDVDGIMEYFSADFYNDGVDWFEERNLWEDRLGATVEILSYASIIFDGDYAVVSFKMKYNGVEYSVPLDGEFTDLVYFKKFGDNWKVYGNQEDFSNKYSVRIVTYPNDANLYLNGLKLDYLSPHTMSNLSEGEYVIGIYLKGYNEIWQDIYLSADTSMYVDLELPTYPKPIFYIDSPQDGDVVDGGSFFLKGFVNDYLGDYAILDMNGEEQTITVDEFGDFHEYINIYDETNTFFLRATNSFGNTGISDDITVCQGEDDRRLTVSVYWDTDATDVDLHVWDPDGNHCYHGDLYAIPNGGLVTTDDDGYGPEVFEMEPLTFGTFTIKAHFYEGYDYLNPTSAEVEITLGDSTYYYGPYEFTGEGDNASAWWYVDDFDVQ